MSNETKPCPFCGAEISEHLFRCQLCHLAWLDGHRAGKREAQIEARAALLSILEVPNDER